MPSTLLHANTLSDQHLVLWDLVLFRCVQVNV